MDRTAVVLQARMGSCRLPGKVLERIGARTLLDHAVTRLQTSGFPVIVATTTRGEDEQILVEAGRLGVEVFQGDETDVLARFLGVARAFGLTAIIRATGDNPFVDGHGPRRIAPLLRGMGVDYVIEHGLPVGAAVEAVTVDALERSAALTDDPYDREHVTALVRRDLRFRQLRAVAPPELRRPSLSLTVDTADDLASLRRLFRSLPVTSPLPTLSAIIRAADALRREAIASKPLGLGA